MNLTRRGYGVVALVVVAELLAFAFGARALNAIAAPAVVVLVAGVVMVRRTETPTAERESVPPGFPGDTRTMTVEVEGAGVAAIEEAVPEGLVVEEPRVERTLPATVTHRIACERRGRHAVGSLTVSVRDVLGLFERTHEVGSTARVLVYPPVYKLAGQQTLREHVLDRSELERREFDTLREYAPGDPLRDVHWKTTAKDPDGIYVTEFADREIDEDVVVAATSEPSAADEMAIAAASIAVMTLEADLGVELRLPEVDVSLGYGPTHRESVLEALATTDGGSLPDGTLADADVHVDADEEGVRVAFGSHTETLDAMTVSRENPLASREATGGVGT